MSKKLLFLLGISNIIFSPITNAQAPAAGSNNPALNLPSNLPSEIKPIQQPGSFFDFDSGSQDFFQQGREQLYFLPDEKPEPILKVDEEIKEEARDNEQGTEVESKKREVEDRK
jgi:hypothetical protein